MVHQQQQQLEGFEELPGDGFPLEGFEELPGDGFPMVIQPLDSSENTLLAMVSGIQRNKSRLEEHLSGSGAVLFRGFPVSDAHDFAKVVEAFGYRSMEYNAGVEAIRRYITGPVFTTNELPNCPDVLMFYCEVAPSQGGETGIIRGQAVYDYMLGRYPEFIHALEDKGIVYYSVLTEAEWTRKFGTGNKAEVEAKAAEREVSKLEWLDNGDLKVCHGPFNAVKKVGEVKTWFNSIGTSIRTFPSVRYLEFGDGSKLPLEALEASLDMMQEQQVPLKWQQGDVLVINNHAVLHSRHPSKPPRRILISILNYD